MTKAEWQKQRRAYRAYLRACRDRQRRVDMADSPSHAAMTDPRPAYVERPVGYDTPFVVELRFGWDSWTVARVCNLVHRHQDRLGIAPTPVEIAPGVISQYAVNETKRRKYTRRLINAIFERQYPQPMEKAA